MSAEDVSSAAKSNVSTGKALTGPLLFCATAAALGSFSFGYNLSVVNTPAKTFENCANDATVWACFKVDFVSWGLVAGMLCVGALIGSLSCGWISDKIGRRKAIMATNIPYILGLGTLALAQNYAMLLVGRVLVGVGVGASCIAVPLYLTEISTITARGLVGSFHQMAIVIGFMAAEVAGYLGLYRPYSWRLMFSLDLIPCLLQLVAMYIFCPESPRYLFVTDRIDEGGKALAKLRGDHFSESERNEIMRACTESRSSTTWGLKELLITQRRESARSMFVAASLHLGQQLSGINSILFFSSSIFASSDPSAIPLMISFLNLLMTVFAILMIDRSGRRFLAIGSSFVMFLSSIALTIAFVSGQDIVSVIAVLAFVGSFAFGLGPVPWLMTTEIFPTQAVGPAVSFAVALNWITNMIVTVSFPKLWILLNNYAFVPYSVFIFLFFLFSLFYLPETKGRPVSFI